MIQFQDVEIRYQDFVAIHDLNLEIGEGEFFTFLGPSGCGKTTTLRALVGFNVPSKGKIFVDDQDITHKPIEKREIGMVFQSYALFPTMSVEENIVFALKQRKKPKDEIEQTLNKMAAIVNLTPQQLKKRVDELSGGQQQRVAIARALALSPKILALDEPLSNLDAKLRKQLRLELKKLQTDFGITVIYVTHDQEEALTLSDRLAVFNNGFVEQVGTPKEIYNHSKTEFVCNFIGDANLVTPSLLKEINRQTGAELNLEKKSYIRTNRVSTHRPQGNVAELEAVVSAVEYYGVYSKYTFQIENEAIYNIEKENGSYDYLAGDVVKVYIDPRDILQY
ncbi:ABC transporter ATP-binding protein [Lachnospiraceae bacterium oral taxon 500]|nr:ABC transporter ATP-binding protein [Lachnospiraceae bacterium oral taxon 500]